MNCNTGHLVTASQLAIMDNLARQNYTAVPAHLDRAATAKLQGRSEATVSLNSGGKLATWAASERKQRRMAKQARKRNR